MPAAKTSAPPSTTWMIALLHGVSIQWFWIQAMAHNSTKTSATATVVAGAEIGHEVRQRVAETTDRGHDAGCEPALDR